MIEMFQTLKALSDFCRKSSIFHFNKRPERLNQNNILNWNIRTTLIVSCLNIKYEHKQRSSKMYLRYVSRCHVISLDLLLLLNFSELKIKRLTANNSDPLVFSVTNTIQQLEKDWVGISLPPEVLKGKG